MKSHKYNVSGGESVRGGDGNTPQLPDYARCGLEGDLRAVGAVCNERDVAGLAVAPLLWCVLGPTG